MPTTSQAVPAEFAKSLPAHWPFGVKADSDSSSDSSGSDDDDRLQQQQQQQQQQQHKQKQKQKQTQTQTQKQKQQRQQREEEDEEEQEEEDADTDSGGEGALPSSAITARQDDMAQQALDALNEAQGLLNEAQGLLGPWQQQPQQQQQQQQQQAQARQATDGRTALPGAASEGGTANPTRVGAGGGGDSGGGGGGGGGGISSRFADRMRRVLRLSRNNLSVDGGGDGTAVEMEEGSPASVGGEPAVPKAPAERAASGSGQTLQRGI